MRNLIVAGAIVFVFAASPLSAQPRARCGSMIREAIGRSLRKDMDFFLPSLPMAGSCITCCAPEENSTS